ncbi:unnamed protein product [Soboliphyme baturini]|uniref:PDZ domain-containing protein n=1 Tax=Soboliphyme baturini TaxID=241478 RepID=A0A183IQR5_9BILA|nr:unnamed protein product [Soboliphyme baturini]
MDRAVNRSYGDECISINGEVVEQVEELKYLGIIFNSDGKFEEEIDRRTGVASGVLRELMRTVELKKRCLYAIIRRQRLGAWPAACQSEKSQLRWCDHVLRKLSEKKAQKSLCAQPIGRGSQDQGSRPRKTGDKCMKGLCSRLGLLSAKVETLVNNRGRWRYRMTRLPPHVERFCEAMKPYRPSAIDFYPASSSDGTGTMGDYLLRREC